MLQLRVLVVGASIAGPMTAYWLAKAGAKVTVIERFPKLRTNGQNIDIRTTGVTVMRKIPGMEEAVRAKIVPMEGMSIVRDDGQPYGTIRATGNPDQQSLLSEYEIYRGDLAQILVDLTKDNKDVEYIFGEEVVSIRQNEKENSPVTVEFANGLPTAEYDLVVACDGSTSRTRAIGLGCGMRDYIEPMNCWIAYCSIKQDLLAGSKISQGHSSPGGRVIALAPDASGINRAAMMSIHPQNDREIILPFREALKKGEDALKKHVVQHFEGCGWIGDKVIEGIIKSDDLYASEIVQAKPPMLYKGRFVLVGDAGYAPGFTGTGTSLAMTGAYMLAGEIVAAKGNLEEGLKAYSERMRPIIDDMQKVPPFIMSIMAPQTAWGIWLRNNIFAFIAWTGALELAQRLFAGSAAGTDKYGLPDYEWLA